MAVAQWLTPIVSVIGSGGLHSQEERGVYSPRIRDSLTNPDAVSNDIFGLNGPLFGCGYFRISGEMRLYPALRGSASTGIVDLDTLGEPSIEFDITGFPRDSGSSPATADSEKVPFGNDPTFKPIESAHAIADRSWRCRCNSCPDVDSNRFFGDGQTKPEGDTW